MAKSYSYYLIEGARMLSNVGFGYSWKKGKWDVENWEETGKKSHGAEILRLRSGVSATKAVQAIFDNPKRWSFDCSQLCQVINFYAQMKTLNASKTGSFDRQIAAHKNRLEIRPFHGAFFTVRQHYYRREKQTEWMKYRAHRSMPYEETRIPAWDLVQAAPVGTRINFNVGAGGEWNYENVIKVKMSPLKFAAAGFDTKIWTAKDLLIELAQKKDHRVRTLKDAAKLIWIKEVSIFQNLPLPPHRSN